MLTIACVENQNYEGRGREYVRNLRSMVARHLTLPHEFVCLSDHPERLGVDAIRAPGHTPGWWAKLALFQPNLFRFGTRIVYFDLDTVIVGNIDKLCRWDGIFGTLRPFRGSGGTLSSGVMSWVAGFGEPIWTKWVESGRPKHPHGDDHWIFEMYPRAASLQSAVPGMIVSYKFHKCQSGPPEGASVVCFARRPKPHDCGAKWVAEAWRE